jgi:ABC-type phosphate/phosphonate transport system ATPase subunit
MHFCEKTAVSLQVYYQNLGFSDIQVIDLSRPRMVPKKHLKAQQSHFKFMTPEMNNTCRIVVIGTSGSGKTVFARELSSALGVPHIELDEVFWSENWVEVPTEAFRASVTGQAAQDSWIIDGNYGVVRDVIWSRADTIVWLDYSFFETMKRLLIRTILRILCRMRVCRLAATITE